MATRKKAAKKSAKKSARKPARKTTARKKATKVRPSIKHPKPADASLLLGTAAVILWQTPGASP